MEQKKHAIVSYETMPEEVAAAFALKYPKGMSDFLPDVKKLDKPNGESIYYVTIEIPNAVYLVKIKMKVDDQEDVVKWLDEDDDDDNNESTDGGETLPDDNIAQYSGGEDEDSAE